MVNAAYDTPVGTARRASRSRTPERSLYRARRKRTSEGGFTPFSQGADHRRRYGGEGLSAATASCRASPPACKDLDAKMGGLQPSDLIIVAGRPGMGKTALATNIAYNIARA